MAVAPPAPTNKEQIMHKYFKTIDDAHQFSAELWEKRIGFTKHIDPIDKKYWVEWEERV